MDTGNSGHDTSSTQMSLRTDNANGSGNRQPNPQKQPRKKQTCRFYGTKRGCRAGAVCPFLHDDPPETLDQSSAKTSSAEPSSATKADSSAAADVTATPPANTEARAPARPSVPVDRSRVISRPVPKAQEQDPRAFQINQLRSRFGAHEESKPDGTTMLHFKMQPSDPDFPFDIDALECVLRLDSKFPKQAKPILRVSNQVMDRGYQINVESGFADIWEQLANPTLLNAMKVLDKRLEELLTAQKASTIKLVSHSGGSNHAPKATPQPTNSDTILAVTEPVQFSGNSHQGQPTPERKEQARLRRDAETSILEHRLGRQALFAKSANGTEYTIPIEPRLRKELAPQLQQLKSAQLIVPSAYDIERAMIKIPGVEGKAVRNTEAAFGRYVRAHPDMTLLNQVNYLAQNMHVMAMQEDPEAQKLVPEKQTGGPTTKIPPVEVTAQSPAIVDTDKSHVKVIPRPPEWTNQANSDEDSAEESSDDSDDDFSADEEEEEPAENVASNSATDARETGVLLSFPYIELHGIELLELLTVNVTIKCERCKESNDITGLRSSETAGKRSDSCKKCAAGFVCGYRKALIHANSSRAGYLDLDGCTVVDMLPSNFLPTCAECSTTYPSPGIVSVRGESSMAICRECHRKMTFRIPDVKFLRVGAAAVQTQRRLPLKKKQRENLGIVTGQELPRRGRCSHYNKSLRWFRFSCCSKVFPCDRCHDAASDHPNELANRMLCGYCSREQNFRPDDCAICHAPLTGKARSGFWEGGKGTRDRVRMSRKDPRKYKRRGTPKTS